MKRNRRKAIESDAITLFKTGQIDIHQLETSLLKYKVEEAKKFKIEEFVPLFKKVKNKAQIAAEEQKTRKLFKKNFLDDEEIVASELEPLEIFPFDPATIRGHSFHDQIIIRQKFFEDKAYREGENRRRYLLRQKVERQGNMKHYREMQIIQYEREQGKFPSVVIDTTLKECLVSRESPMRVFFSAKYGFT